MPTNRMISGVSSSVAVAAASMSRRHLVPRGVSRRQPSSTPTELGTPPGSASRPGPWSPDERTSASDGDPERLGHRPVPGRRRDEAKQVGRAGHLELVEKERDLRRLRGEDLVLRGKLPDLPLERADRLLAGRVDANPPAWRGGIRWTSRWVDGFVGPHGPVGSW
jgi:hypothetical protein